MYSNSMNGRFTTLYNQIPMKDKFTDLYNNSTLFNIIKNPRYVFDYLLPYCGEIIHNPSYKFAVQKMCCSATTFYPEKSFHCSDLRQDIDSLLLKNYSSDSIYSACSWEKGKTPNFLKVTTKTHDPLAQFSHVPISCIVNGNITIVSINFSGLCHREKPVAENYFRLDETSRITVMNSSTENSSDREEIAIEFIQEQLDDADVICLQDIYLPDFIDPNGKLVKRLLRGNTEFNSYYDGFTGAILVRKELVQIKTPLKKQTIKIEKKGGTRRFRGGGENKPIPFSTERNRPKQSVLKITKEGTTMYVVNVSLSPLYHSKKKSIHENEMRKVFDYLKSVNAFSYGVIFIGDHKHQDIDLYKLK